MDAGDPGLESVELFQRWEASAVRSRARRNSRRKHRPAWHACLLLFGLAVTLTAASAAVGFELQDGLTRPATNPQRAQASHLLPSHRSFAAAERFAASRAGLVSFAVVDSAGRLRGLSGRRHYISASVVKALLLAAEVRRLERQGLVLDPLTRELLTRMVTYSDNPSADAIYQRVGDDGLRGVAESAGLRDFAVYGHWATAQLTAEDMARFMASLDEVLAGAHREFASRQLASIVPEQRWGIPSTVDEGWRVRFKGGWRATEHGELVHQVAALDRDGQHLSLAILTDGQPTTEYGIATVSGIASRLMRRPISRSAD